MSIPCSINSAVFVDVNSEVPAASHECFSLEVFILNVGRFWAATLFWLRVVTNFHLCWYVHLFSIATACRKISR